MRDPDANIPNIENGPMVFIANEMTPFSNGDVWVFSNCEELKLTVSGKEPQTIKVKDLGANMPHPPVKFEKVFTWADIQRMGRSQNKDAGKITVEGLIGGKVAATAVKSPAKRETRLVLEVDLDGTPLLADGSDIVTVIASLVDQNRNVKRLGEEEVVFEVSGEGRMIAENESWANPRKIEWGTAPCLVQSTTTAGKITVNAHTLFEGINIALPATITFESVPSPHPFLFYENGSLFVSESSGKKEGINNEQIELLNNKIRQLESELNKIKLKEVEKQQSSFEIKLP
jgi:beta-galactosidase